MPPVKRAPRRRREQQAAQTRQRIVDAATVLFADPGYAATTISAIAERADVAVETVYARFRTKAGVLDAVLEPAVVGNDQGLDILDLPAIAEVRACTDQRDQVRLLAGFSRTLLERAAPVQHILALAAAVDPGAADLRRRDVERRATVQAAYIEMLRANGPLRDGLDVAEAAATYAAMANPGTFSLLTDQYGWSPDAFEVWLADSLTRVLLDP
ncbi:TetR family transcriptional regulator [Actinomycetospora sp. NBRC 106375]|uniref:TetR/AcrR family transcriptional regulator n=1 Tax=Actinomycetospora sp. NBRC 106375 TaxID=3032207 RepID=UPI0024A2E404|nr:TetR/AcrR family transcriptional regulator [Actinomycetospora sp. NBRC 106375]GLZ48827.1 TetR family transcriptional regulator [Actinomycetospora sp. NBRC 106375]